MLLADHVWRALALDLLFSCFDSIMAIGSYLNIRSLKFSHILNTDQCYFIKIVLYGVRTITYNVHNLLCLALI
jgi:hypothetical protein